MTSVVCFTSYRLFKKVITDILLYRTNRCNVHRFCTFCSKSLPLIYSEPSSPCFQYLDIVVPKCCYLLEVTNSIQRNTNIPWANRKVCYENSQHSRKIIEEIKSESKMLELRDLTDISEILEALKLCYQQQEYPSDNVLLMLANILSSCGNIDGLELIQTIFRDKNQGANDVCLTHYFAQAIWINGNLKKSLYLLNIVYESNDYLKETVEFMLHKLILHVISAESKAAVNVIDTYIQEFTNRHNNYSLLATLWYALFNSKLYEDQKSANEILLNSEMLRNHIESYLPIISGRLLKFNQVEDFYRLLESLLQCEMHNAFEKMMCVLFDYYYGIGDVERCIAVVECCRKLHTKLTRDQEYKFKNLIGEKPSVVVPHHPTIKFKF